MRLRIKIILYGLCSPFTTAVKCLDTRRDLHASCRVYFVLCVSESLLYFEVRDLMFVCLALSNTLLGSSGVGLGALWCLFVFFIYAYWYFILDLQLSCWRPVNKVSYTGICCRWCFKATEVVIVSYFIEFTFKSEKIATNRSCLKFNDIYVEF